MMSTKAMLFIFIIEYGESIEHYMWSNIQPPRKSLGVFLLCARVIFK